MRSVASASALAAASRTASCSACMAHKGCTHTVTSTAGASTQSKGMALARAVAGMQNAGITTHLQLLNALLVSLSLPLQALLHQLQLKPLVLWRMVQHAGTQFT